MRLYPSGIHLTHCIKWCGEEDKPNLVRRGKVYNARKVLNKVQSKSVEVTSNEIWTNKKPYLSHLKIWGYPAYMKRTVSDKLEVKSDDCLLVGYLKETIGYQFYNTLEQRLFVSKRVIFLKKEFLPRRDSGSKGELREVQDAQTNTNQLI